MIHDHRYVLYVAETHGYRSRLAAIVSKLAKHLPEKNFDWKRRTTLWLSNFKGLKDQRIAFDMLERLLVVSEDGTKDACQKLLAAIHGHLAKGKSVFHFAHETSGLLLVRLLEKELDIPNDRILRPHDFDKPPTIEAGSVVVIWDRFNGTGKQLGKQLEKYEPMFNQSAWNGPIVCFAYLAGHPVKCKLPKNVHVLRAIEEVPSVHHEKYAEQKELCARYAAIANPSANTKYDTGALIAFADNVPNNIPAILRSPKTSIWRPLLVRRGTKSQSKTSALNAKISSAKHRDA